MKSSVPAAPESHKSLDSDFRWKVVERIIASTSLKSSPRLCEFLLYVAKCAIQESPDDATEQQIGIHIFGRPPGYNSSQDSIVRTHARLLRLKLEAYFAQEGAAEPFIVEIPRGHYLPVFTQRSQNAALNVNAAPQETQATLPTTGRTRQRVRRNFALAGAALLGLVCIGLLAWRPWSKTSGGESPVDVFWRPFLTGESPPIVVFTNSLFIGDAAHGLNYAHSDSFNSRTQGPYNDTYTGVGDVTSVYNLTRVFDSQKSTFILKRSLLLTWDEAQSRNLIFVGANPLLRDLPPTTDFAKVSSADTAGIVNRNPNPGEQALYSRPKTPLTRDYAILAMFPGMRPGKHILLFSGLTTYGTQAAVEFVCQPESTAELLRKITTPKGELRPFEAVIETAIVRGVPMHERLVAIHVH